MLQMNKAQPLVCVIDDDDAVREAVCELATSVGMAVRDFAHCQAFFNDPQALDCDCCILDVRLPDCNGLRLQEQLVAQGHSPPVIFISGHGDIPMVVQAMRQGAIDFLEKPFGTQALLDRIHEAVAHSAARRRRQVARATVEARIALLTPRELEVMGHLAVGRTSKAIGQNLGISVRTVEHHRGRVMRKMRVNSLAALMEALAIWQP